MTLRLGAVVAGENIWKPLGEREKKTLIHKLDRIDLFSEGITKLQMLPRVWNFERSLKAGTVVEKDAYLCRKYDYYVCGDARLK